MRHKEEQRRAVAGLLILLIVAHPVAVAFQISMNVRHDTPAGD